MASAGVQQHATSVAEDEPYVEFPDQAWQRKQLWAYLYESCTNGAEAATTTASGINISEAQIWANAGIEAKSKPDLSRPVYEKTVEGRSFEACVFCAMLH